MIVGTIVLMAIVIATLVVMGMVTVMVMVSSVALSRECLQKAIMFWLWP